MPPRRGAYQSHTSATFIGCPLGSLMRGRIARTLPIGDPRRSTCRLSVRLYGERFRRSFVKASRRRVTSRTAAASASGTSSCRKWPACVRVTGAAGRCRSTNERTRPSTGSRSPQTIAAGPVKPSTNSWQRCERARSTDAPASPAPCAPAPAAPRDRGGGAAASDRRARPRHGCCACRPAPSPSCSAESRRRGTRDR